MAVFLSKCEELLKLIPELQCHKCKNVPGPTQKDRYSCTNAAHTLCEEHKIKCPCGSKVGKSPSPVISKLLQNLPWMCKNYKMGCREIKMNVEDLDHHQRKCVYREVYCPEIVCKKEKVLFKDILIHLKKCIKIPIFEEKMSNKEANKFDFDVWIDPGLELENEDSWAPSKMTSTCGGVFFSSVYVKNETLYVWICLLGSSDEAKKFSVTYSMKNKLGEIFVYTGPVHTLDKNYEAIITSGSLLGIGIDAVKRSLDGRPVDGEKQLKFEINIRNLKEEAKDEDLESGVSDNESLLGD